MKKNSSIMFLVSCVLCISACIGFISAKSLVQEFSLYKTKNESQNQVNTFFEQGISDKFVNEKAEQKLKLTVKQPDDGRKALATYKAPEGFEMVSYSKNWDENKLEKLYEELKLNKHGEEIYSLSYVRVNGDDDGYALGSHQNQDSDVIFKFLYPTLPSHFEMKFPRRVGVIDLYGGDTKVTVESMAVTLSHEYGHHFTYYHMLGDTEGRNTKYSNMRDKTIGVIQYEVNDYEDYLYNHQWYFAEIAASDYVVLMGSPTTRQIYDVYDTKDILNSSWEIDFEKVQECINTSPQENLRIPSPMDVVGLEEYFYSFIDDSPPEHSSEKLKIDINIEKKSESYALDTGDETFYNYEITWNKPYDDKGAIYTLLCFDNYSSFSMPIKTVKANEDAVAYIGTLTKSTSSTVYFLDDKLSDLGTINFAVSVVLSDGTVYLSSPKNYKF